MAMRLPVFVSGGCGAAQPSSKARSAMAHSMVLIVTGTSSMLSVQAASHGRRTNAARHLGEVVRRVEVLRRLLPVAVIDEVVPVGDLVVDRAAGVTIGNAAVHAARCLDLRVLIAQRLHEFVVVLHALGDRSVLALGPLEFEKARSLSHTRSLSRRRADGPCAVARSHHFTERRKSSSLGHLEADLDLLDPSLSAACALAMSSSALRYSTGITFLNFGR